MHLSTCLKESSLTEEPSSYNHLDKRGSSKQFPVKRRKRRKQMAMILDAFVGKFAEKLLDLIQEPVVRLLGVEEDLQQLHWRLENIKDVLVDAERKRYTDTAIDAWVRQLKDVMYDADDMIDLWKIKLLSDSAASSSSPPSKKVRRFGFTSLFSSFSSPPLRNEISLSIKHINERLDTIAKNKSEFNLQHIRSEIYISKVNPRQTCELVDTDVVGDDIENATKELVQLLIGRKQQPCILLAISGMGGIGKTTLAQKIFNESRMQTRFSVRIWVCISQDFNEINLIKQIIRGTGEDPVGVGAADTKSELVCLLKKTVYGKQVFLVLDDVWQGQEDVWNELLRNPLKGGASITRILVTTRDENVARKMGAMHIHRVDQLSNAFGWKLLHKSVFVNGEEEDDVHDLEETGVKIVEKCHGLPLAIKVISGILKTKNQIKKEWEEVLADNSWSMSKLPEELRGALYLSYEVLPSHLKQCFLYLSLFPEDYIYDRWDLVRMWVAEGFVKTDGDLLLEDLAVGYYDELIRRNLLQIEPNCPDGTRCQMHDLLQSLAKYLSGDEVFYGNPQVLNTSTSKSKLRRLSIANTGEVVGVPESTTGQDSLRTLILFRIVSRLEHVKFLNFRFLRVLRLNGKGIQSRKGIQSLPHSLENLVHLRLLDLNGTNISMIPESIGCLTNLQILNLMYCELLHTLPRGITRLCNLRCLGVIGTPLSYLPKGIGELKQLNDLQGFFVGGKTEEGDRGCNLEELGSLAQLRELWIEKLERASTASFTFASNPHLKMLGMSCTPLDRESSDHNVPYSEELERLFEQLSPPPCIELLHIGNYFGRRFPSWMMSSTSSMGTYFSYLTILNLHNCVLCPVLPPVGQLPQLKLLHISGASSVVTIGPEFLGVVNSNPRERKPTVFPKLEVLKIANMPKWEEWSFGKEIDEQESESLAPIIRLLPQLKKLELGDCPELRALPKGLSHCRMQTLHIEGAQKLTTIENLPHLTTWMEVKECGSLETVSHLPALRELNIIECPAMKCVERLDSLQILFLSDGSMECLPDWLPTLIQQTATSPNDDDDDDDDDDNFFFKLDCNIDSLRRCCEGCPDWPIIQQIPRVNVNEIGGSTCLSYTKQPFSYATNS